MATTTTKDSTQIYYKDWGEGQAINKDVINADLLAFINS